MKVDQPVLTYPGAYRKVSVELKIHHLAVNALLKSNQVNEMEGGSFTLVKCFCMLHKGTPVSERAVPVAIFETDAELIKFHVKKWCKISSYVGIRSIIDWSYYKQHLCSAIQKIVTIPAAMQKVSYPVPRVIHREKEDKYCQRKLVDIFSSKDKDDAKGQRAISDSDNNGMGGQNIEDMEDFRTSEKFSATGPRPTVRCYEVPR